MVNSLAERRRVAHVPNVGALLQKPASAAAASTSTPASEAGSSSADTPAKTVTPAQTAPRDGKRLAHTPGSVSTH